MKYSTPLHVAIPPHKYRMRFIAASARIVGTDDLSLSLSLQPLPIPKQAQESTVEWVKARNRIESIRNENK